MTNRPLTSLLCPAVIVGIAALLFAVQRKSKSNVLLSEIHNTIKENAEVTRALKRTLRLKAAQSTQSATTWSLYQKGSKNTLPKRNKTIGRISQIGPYQKVWVK